MTLSKLASLIAKREGKKSQARIGDIREIIGILCDIYYESGFVGESIDFTDMLEAAGEKRHAKRKKSDKRKAAGK